jgi:hypothetical protein
LERAFNATWDSIKSSGQHFDTESDEELEAALRRELIEIARLNGASNPESLKDILLASMPPARAALRRQGSPGVSGSGYDQAVALPPR